MKLPLNLPQIPYKKKGSNTSVSNCYSITIRTGKGINLGSNPLIRLEKYIKERFSSYIFTIEMENENAHFQGGVLSTTPIRQDKLREKLLDITIDMYKEQVSFITTKGLANLKKHAVKVVSHNDWDILQRYCLKDENSPIYLRSNDVLPINIYPERYCEHGNPKGCPKCFDLIPDPTWVSFRERISIPDTSYFTFSHIDL